MTTLMRRRHAPSDEQRRSIGIAIGIPEPYGRELQLWRERVGDPNAHQIVPHVTLVPPTPVRAGELPTIEEHLRKVAAEQEPFEIRLRGSATFLPVSPVVFVQLARGISECEQIAGAARSGPLGSTPEFPYHPHVTVAHDLPSDALARAELSLEDYSATFGVYCFTLFERDEASVWRPMRDFALGSGGLPGPVEAVHRPDDAW